MDTALQLRDMLLKCECCEFQAEITADYGEQLYRFAVDCRADRDGNVSFTVIEPQSISGVTGEIHMSRGRLTFDHMALGFPLMVDGVLSPVSGPWILLKSLRSGYLASCAETESGMRLTLQDSYEENTLQIDVWTDPEGIPCFAEIVWKGQRILSFKIDNFVML